MKNADNIEFGTDPSRLAVGIVVAICACVVLDGCATVKRIVPWGNSDSEASTSSSAGQRDETQPTAGEAAAKPVVDLSVPQVDRKQSVIVSDAAALRSATISAESNSEASASRTDPASLAKSDDWGRAVQEAIHARWIQPRGPKIPTDFSCDVMVKLTPFGGVDDVKVVRSCGDPALDASVETAVRESSPLPIPTNPDEFSDTLLLSFTPR
ncbi:MAG: TonB family protein [Dokdonella sp.]